MISERFRFCVSVTASCERTGYTKEINSGYNRLRSRVNSTLATPTSHLERCNMSPARNLSNKLFIYCISWRGGERFIIQFSILVERAMSGYKCRVSRERTVLQQIVSVHTLLPSLSDLRCPFGSNFFPSHSALLYRSAV